MFDQIRDPCPPSVKIPRKNIYKFSPAPYFLRAAAPWCSALQCRAAAVATYHRYECDMRLYELIPAEGKVESKNQCPQFSIIPIHTSYMK